MENTIETIKTCKDGCKLMKFNGTEFWVSPYGTISQTDDWSITDKLVSAGLATRKFYKHLYGHIEYKMK